MEMENRLREQSQRIAQVKSWAKRIEKLKSRKKNPMSEFEFCMKYGIEHTHFNFQKNGHVLPRKQTIEKIENALKKEGV